MLGERGLLTVDDPLLAAQHFLWLVLSIPMNRAMFDKNEDLFTRAELERFADDGVATFLRAYGVRAGRGGRP